MILPHMEMHEIQTEGHAINFETKVKHRGDVQVQSYQRMDQVLESKMKGRFCY